VLYNYVSNAIKFTGRGGRIVIRTGIENDRLFRLEVEDDGIGIEPSDAERLFVPFEQIHTRPPGRTIGTGLGLALTRKLVEAQGGTVGVRSEPGRGATFHALLPRRGGAGRRPSAAGNSSTVVVVTDATRGEAS
jgi:signal transduction histidine kinase